MSIFPLTLINCLITFLECININPLTDYDNNWFWDKGDVRTKFHNKKKQIKKIELFDKLNSNKAIFVDDILHLERNDKKIKEMEDSFRNLLAMKDYKYIYKRDYFWRTFRVVEAEPGNFTVVCYRCQGVKNDMKDKCSGYWVIEENPPPCPLEVFSFKTGRDLCAANYTQYSNISQSSCPSTIPIRDLTKVCDNPIKTRWRITRKFTDLSERKSVICQGRESCEISSLYSFIPNSIVFRLINSTNHIFYSRVMTNWNKNYLCIDDCGKIDPKTELISKNEQPFRLDLLKKNKREDPLSMPSALPDAKKKQHKKIDYVDRQFEVRKFTEMPKSLSKKSYPVVTKEKNLLYKSDCKKLQEKYYDFENENDIDY